MARTDTGLNDLTIRLNELRHDPFTWVIEMFRWGQGELAGHTGPDRWQAEVLKEIGRDLKRGWSKGIHMSSSHDLYTPPRHKKFEICHKRVSGVELIMQMVTATCKWYVTVSDNRKRAALSGQVN